MERIIAALADVEQQAGSGPVTLLAHSAGGWLSRVFLLEVCSVSLSMASSPLKHLSIMLLHASQRTVISLC